jgi:hypothetical protein
LRSPLPPAPPATDEDHRRWAEAIEADELRRSIQPLNDGYLPPAALAEQRRRQHEALCRYEHHRTHLSEFMGQIDALVHDVAIKSAAAQEAARQRVTGQALLKRIGGIEIGRGLQVLEQVRTQHEIARARRAKPGASRSKAGGSGLSVSDQLTHAIQAADAWLANVNPNPYGILAVGQA